MSTNGKHGLIETRHGGKARLVAIIPATVPTWAVYVAQRHPDTEASSPPKLDAPPASIHGMKFPVMAWAHILVEYDDDDGDCEAEVKAMIDDGEGSLDVASADKWGETTGFAGTTTVECDADDIARAAWPYMRSRLVAKAAKAAKLAKAAVTVPHAKRAPT